MSSSSSPALALDLPALSGSRAPILLVIVLLLLLAGLMVVAVMQGSVWMLAGLFAGFTAVLVMMLWSTGYWQVSRRLIQLVWSQQGDWLLHYADGHIQAARLSAQSWITPWLWCLRFEAPDRGIPPVLIWRSQLSPGAWQLWRTRLFLEGRAQPRVGAAH